MHKGHDPSRLSGEATAGYALSTHVDMHLGLGETGDLLMDLGLPQPSQPCAQGKSSHHTRYNDWKEGGLFGR